MLGNGGGFKLRNEDKNASNSVKYSIWETRTDPIRPRSKEKFAAAIEKSLQAAKEKGVQE